jgi:hypothetical protein
MSAHSLLDLGDLRIASNETRRRGTQVARVGVEPAQRREVLTQTRRPHLKQSNRARHISEPTWPQIEHVDAVDQRRRRVRGQNLAAMPGRHHPGGAVQHSAEVVTVLMRRLARCDSHPHRQLQLPLSSHRPVDCRPRRGKCGNHAIAGVLDQESAFRLDRGPQRLVVCGQRRASRPRRTPTDGLNPRYR